MLSEAATNFLKEECPRRARRSLTLAHLAGLQLQMTDRALLNMSPTAVSQFLLTHPDVAEVCDVHIWLLGFTKHNGWWYTQAVIVAAAYDKIAQPEWTMPVYTNVVVHGRLQYLEDFRLHFGTPQGFYRDMLTVFMKDPLRREHAANFQVRSKMR
jgi:hypothetical protein